MSLTRPRIYFSGSYKEAFEKFGTLQAKPYLRNLGILPADLVFEHQIQDPTDRRMAMKIANACSTALKTEVKPEDIADPHHPCQSECWVAIRNSPDDTEPHACLGEVVLGASRAFQTVLGWDNDYGIYAVHVNREDKVALLSHYLREAPDAIAKVKATGGLGGSPPAIGSGVYYIMGQCTLQEIEQDEEDEEEKEEKEEEDEEDGEDDEDDEDDEDEEDDEDDEG